MNELRKATTFKEILQAVNFNDPVSPDHEFFTDFSDVRGDFEDLMIYMSLNVDPQTMVYDRDGSPRNKPLIFLAGMRGSGKTSELAKIAKKIHHKDAFFCVTCNLDKGLDINDMEYMDILVFQMERLIEEISKKGLEIDESNITNLQRWYEQQVKEVNKIIKREGGIEIEVKSQTPSFLNFLKITGKLKANLAGVKENAERIRTVLKKNFTDFSQQFNIFIEEVNQKLRHSDIAKELLFVIDGLEKIATVEIRRRIIEDESNRFQQIKVSTIFTLPIELFRLEPKLRGFSEVISFPCVKLQNKDGTPVPEATDRFREFILKRIDRKLIDSSETLNEMIWYGGGSPRELLRVIRYTYIFSSSESLLTKESLDKAVKKLAAEYSKHLSLDDLDKLKILHRNNRNGRPTPTVDQTWQDLIESLVVLEYNDGTYKRVHPLVEKSELYQQYVISDFDSDHLAEVLS